MAASALSGSYVSACDLSSALGRLFSAVAVVVAGLQTRQRDGREPPCHPEGSEGSAFRRCISAKPSCKPCPSPSTSTPATPIPGAKPSASPTNSPPITWSLIPHRQRQSRPQPLVPQRRRTHPVPPISTQFVP